MEDAPGKFGEDQDSLTQYLTTSVTADAGILSQRLETEAARQRASSL